MGRREKPLDARSTPIVDFARDLRKLRASAGNPPYREMAKVALFSSSVLSSAASGHRLPTLQVTLGFVDACGGSRGRWESRWRSLRMHLSAETAKTSRRENKVGAPKAASNALNVHPAQLPVGSDHLVGREAELTQARAAIARGVRIPLVIGGMVGAGKTAFALRLTREVASEFSDGQLFADVGGTRPDPPNPYDVMAGFLGALGIAPDQIPRDHAQRTGLYRSILAQRRVIVLLDDVRSEAEVRPLLVQSPRSQIVVTSRARLLGLDGVNRITIDTLTRAESIELIRALIGHERARAEHDASSRLADLCDDLPLALAIAGRKIAALPNRPVAEIIRPFASGTQGIHWLRVGDASLMAPLTSAYQSLSPFSLVEVFHLLGSGGILEANAAGISRRLQMPVDSAELALERLVDHGLLRHPSIGARYVLPAPVAQFSRQKADQFVGSWPDRVNVVGRALNSTTATGSARPDSTMPTDQRPRRAKRPSLISTSDSSTAATDRNLAYGGPRVAEGRQTVGRRGEQRPASFP